VAEAKLSFKTPHASPHMKEGVVGFKRRGRS
jgi:hypothetical protein